MRPANDLSQSHRRVLHKALGIARDAFGARRPDVARPSRRFRAEVSYEDRRHHLAASAVTARSDHGRVAAISNSREFAIEVQPYNERHRTPLVRIVGRRPSHLPTPLPDQDAIVAEIDRLISWSESETDPLRYDRRAVMAAILGTQLQIEGLTADRVGRPLFIAPTPWSAGRIGIEETISFRLMEAERRACSSFCDRNRDLVAQAFEGRPTYEMRSETKESEGRLRMIIDMTAPIQFAVSPMDPMEAMRRIAA
jgi:hypothetical protein